MPPQSTTTDVRARASLLEADSAGMGRNEEKEEIVRGMLREERDHLSRVDQEIRRLESVLAGLYEERTACVGRLDAHALSLAPHKRLPHELLARVFLEVQGGQPVVLPPHPDGAPWVLRRVCSRWRSVARGEGQLWGNLDVEDRQTEGAVLAWIPRLWSPDQAFPVSLSLGESAAGHGRAVCRVLEPYLHRMRALSLCAPKESLPSVFVRHAGLLGALESLAVHILPPSRGEKQFFPGRRQRVAMFGTSTRLRKAVFTACPYYRVDWPRFYKLPWGQLTHLTFHMVLLSLGDFQSVLGQCSHLVSLTFTSTRSHAGNHYMNEHEILLPRLESITVVLEAGDCYWQSFGLLRLPSLKEVTFDHSEYTKFRFESDHAKLDSLIKRSGCRIKSLSLLGSVARWGSKLLLAKLPHLVRLVVAQPKRMSVWVFETMAQGTILQSLEHLECFTSSPVAFLKLMERQCMDPAWVSNGHRGICTAKIEYDRYTREEELDATQVLHERLKPELERCGKDVLLKEISADLEALWGDPE